MPAPHYPHHTVPDRTRVTDYATHHTETGDLHSRHKRRFPAEVQAAMDQFRRQFSAALADVRRRLADNFDQPGVTDPVNLVSVVVDKEGDKLRGRLRNGATDGAEAGVRMARRRFDLSVSFDQPPQSAIDAVEDVVASYESDVMQTLTDGIESDLRGWLDEGLTTGEIRNRLLSAGYQSRLDDRLTETHARTIVQGAAERGNHIAMDAAQGVIGEQWNATNDGRARDTHLEAEGQISPVNSSFIVGGVRLSHPGDPEGPLREIANCRCFMTPVMSEDLSNGEIAELRVGNRLNV